MAENSDTDSVEDEIWNYKSVAKERTQSNKQVAAQENISGQGYTKSRRNSCHSLQKNETNKCINKTNVKQIQVKGKLKIVKTADKNEAINETEVINVDLETECEFASPKFTLAKNNTNKISQNKKLAINTSKTKVYSSSGDSKLNNTLSSNKASSNSKKAKYKMTASNASRSTKGTLSSSQEKSVSVVCHNIHKYFSPTKNNKRKSSESVDSLFSFTEDELMFVQEEKSDIFHEAEMKTPLQICDTHSGKDINCQKKNNGVNETIDSGVGQENLALCSDSWDNLLSQTEYVNTDVICNKQNVINSDFSLTCFGNVNPPPLCNDEVNIPSPGVDEVNTPAPCIDIVETPQKSFSTLEGGFFIVEDSCWLESCAEDHKMRDRCEIQYFSSSNESSSDKISLLSSESDIYSAAVEVKSSIKSFNKVENAEDKHIVARRSSVAVGELPSSVDKQPLMTTPRKQTSIFSFFKAQYGSSLKTSILPINNKNIYLDSPRTKTLQNDHSKIQARPNLPRRNTVAVPFPSHRATDSQKKIKSVSGVETPEEGKEEQPQTNTRNKRQCPFYKKIPNTAITVDAFSYGVIPGCQAYVLTHFHYDHYGGLTKRFAQPIFCSQVTGNLVEHRLGVDKKWINPLPLWKPCQVAGVTLTLMEANHCPGAVMILFELKDGRKIVHTGDFRACPEMQEYLMLKEIVTSELYLDTTYCNPSYTFPTQNEVINFAVSLALTYIGENPETLIACGTYTIGKEKIFAAIAQALDSKICVTRDKKKVLDCLEDKELKSRLTLDWSAGQVHVLPMGKLNQKGLFEHLACNPQFKTVLAFEPTGWTYSGKTSLESLGPKWSKNGVTLYGLPYSEHSSFLELKHFIQFLHPKRIIPTVNNGNPAARKKMEDTFTEWMREDLSSSKISKTTSQQRKLSQWMSSEICL